MSGLVHIYCGDGKGKTTAAFGLALRSAGCGNKVVVAQFLKDGQSGECRALRTFSNVVLLGCNPSGKFSFRMDEAEKEQTRQASQQTLREALAAARDARLLVLDEVMAAVSSGFLTVEEVVEAVTGRPSELELVMTGRNPPAELTALADYISEVRKIRHPFDRGIAARDGIER